MTPRDASRILSQVQPLSRLPGMPFLLDDSSGPSVFLAPGRSAYTTQMCATWVVFSSAPERPWSRQHTAAFRVYRDDTANDLLERAQAARDALLAAIEGKDIQSVPEYRIALDVPEGGDVPLPEGK